MKSIVNLSSRINNLKYRVFLTQLFKDIPVVQTKSRMTGIDFYHPLFRRSSHLRISDRIYGPTQLRDFLCDTLPHECLVFIGAAGSLDPSIQMGDFIIPYEIATGYLQPKLGGKEVVRPARDLAIIFRQYLDRKFPKVHLVKTGTAYAVNDEDTDIAAYTHRAFDGDVKAIECEAAEGLYFAEKNNINAIAVLYCSDAKKTPLVFGKDEELDARRHSKCRNAMMELNRCAVEILG